MIKKYVISDTAYCMTGTMGTGESFPCRNEIILTVENDCLKMVEQNMFVSHEDIRRYFQMSIEEYFEHEMVSYRCNQTDVEFKSLEPLNQDGYIIVRNYTDFSDLSLITRKWIYDRALDDGKINFKKYIIEYCENKTYEEKWD